MDNEIINEESLDNEIADEPAEEQAVPNKEKKYITLDETITLQAIICVVISILFVAANMFAPKISEELSEEFKKNYSVSSDFTNKTLETFLRFLNSKPVSYD